MYEKETIIDKIGRVISKLGTFLMMNLMFVVSCLPVVTIGQAWCALLSSVRYLIRGDSWWHGFKFGFKTRFLRGTLAWCLLLAADIALLMDVWQYTNTQVPMVYIIASCVMFSLMIMLTTAFLILNVYIPTDVSNWIKNAASLIFKAPLQLLGAAALMWAPVVCFLYKPEWIWYFIMVFVVAYFVIATFAATILLKGALMDYLIEARAEGTLLAEEGRVIEKDEEEEDS